MQNLTDQNSIEKYSKDFSEKIIKDVYQTQERISGQDILNLTPVRQVNLFIIKSLLFRWKKETEQLESPYFDYTDPNVQKALSTFMNTVSRHISVKEADMRPLIERAVFESICIIFYPYDFYTQLIEKWKEDHLLLKDLKQINKYIKVNDSVMNSIIARIEQEGKTKVTKEEGIEIFNAIMESMDLSPADTEEYLSQFNSVLPLKLEELNNDVSTSDKEKAKEEGAEAEKEVIEQPKEDVEDKDDKKEHVTLNDEMQKKGNITIANIHEKQKIEKVSKYISINQKFMFINRLFDKDWGKFEKAISFLDSTDDENSIIQYLDENAPAWREEGEEAEEFRNVLEKKLGTAPI